MTLCSFTSKYAEYDNAIMLYDVHPRSTVAKYGYVCEAINHCPKQKAEGKDNQTESDQDSVRPLVIVCMLGDRGVARLGRIAEAEL